MSEKRIFHEIPCLITGLAVSTIPIAGYILRPYLNNVAICHKGQGFLAHPERTSLDEKLRRSARVAKPEPNLSSFSSTNESDGSYRIITSVSLAAINDTTGISASLMPRSSMGVFTRENMSNNHYETSSVEFHVMSGEKALQSCQDKNDTNRSHSSNISFRASREESRKNGSESSEDDLRPRKT